MHSACPSPSSLNRRTFLRRSLFVRAAFAAPNLVSASAPGADGAVAANNRVNLGVIGTGNQGFNDMEVFLGDNRVQLVAVCDVNRESPGYWDGTVRGREPGRQMVAMQSRPYRAPWKLPA